MVLLCHIMPCIHPVLASVPQDTSAKSPRTHWPVDGLRKVVAPSSRRCYQTTSCGSCDTPLFSSTILCPSCSSSILNELPTNRSLFIPDIVVLVKINDNMISPVSCFERFKHAETLPLVSTCWNPHFFPAKRLQFSPSSAGRSSSPRPNPLPTRGGRHSWHRPRCPLVPWRSVWP